MSNISSSESVNVSILGYNKPYFLTTGTLATGEIVSNSCGTISIEDKYDSYDSTLNNTIKYNKKILDMEKRINNLETLVQTLSDKINDLQIIDIENKDNTILI